MSNSKADNSDARKTRDSKSYQKAKNKAEEYINSPEKLGKLVSDATEKAKRKSGPLEEVRDSLLACFRLIKAYANGSYREIPWQSLLMIVASVIYFVMPIDFIPDIILGLGLVDDIALLGWTIKSFSTDIDAFVEWERRPAA